ncbi:uncharacterized protein [Ptychodera flava]|uniref:uncharacterized protein n=1 Tax=Ptychodera flava TaxID=63121 RepID=UPI00396A06B2
MATAVYSSMKVPELKDMLRARGIYISGKKTELIERLQLSDLSQCELKNQLKKFGLSQSGSVPDLVKRLQAHKNKTRETGSTLIDAVEIPQPQRSNPFKDPWPMMCRGCGQVVPNSEKMAHVDSCWFQDGQPNVYFMHAESRYWGGRFELLMAFPLGGSFKDIDMALRFTWMQCCNGHRSEMDIYSAQEIQNSLETGKQPKEVVMLNSRFIDGLQDLYPEKPMETPLQTYTEVGGRMFYAYDVFDETTIDIKTISLKCLKRPLYSPFDDFTRSKHILMRNELVEIPCFNCTSPCKFFGIPEMRWSEDDQVNNNNNGDDDDDDIKFFCSKPCGKSAGFRSPQLKPFLNSPRSGCCKYTGQNYF